MRQKRGQEGQDDPSPKGPAEAGEAEDQRAVAEESRVTGERERRKGQVERAASEKRREIHEGRRTEDERLRDLARVRGVRPRKHGRSPTPPGCRRRRRAMQVRHSRNSLTINSSAAPHRETAPHPDGPPRLTVLT